MPAFARGTRCCSCAESFVEHLAVSRARPRAKSRAVTRAWDTNRHRTKEHSTER